MIIQTSRFGQVEIQSEDILHFPEGILGFTDHKQFVLLEDPNDELFAWLQSCTNDTIAFPILEPELFMDSYTVRLSKSDYELLKMLNLEKARLFCIVTIPDDPTLMTANLKAPLVINVPLRLSRQCVLQDNSLAIREPIFLKLKQRVIQNQNDFVRKVEEGMEVSIKLPPSRDPEKTL